MFDEAIKIDPKYVNAYYNKGLHKYIYIQQLARYLI